MQLNRTENSESTAKRRPVGGRSIATVLRLSRAVILLDARWIPWIAIVAYASVCIYWKPPALDQSWWLVLVALWAVPSGSISQIGTDRIPLIVVASCILVFAWAFYRMQVAAMDSMYTWRFAQDLHCYDPVSRSIRITIAGTATALALAIPLCRIAGRVSMPIAALSVLPFVLLAERYWLDRPAVTILQLLTTLIPPSLFLSVCFFLKNTAKKHSELLSRGSWFMRWELRNAHGGIASLVYAIVLFLIIAAWYLEFYCGYQPWSSAAVGWMFIFVMFAFGRVTVATWQNFERKVSCEGLGKYIGKFGKGTVAMSCIIALVLSLFEAPIAGQAIAGTIEQVGPPPWGVRVDGTVLLVSGLIRRGIANAAEEVLRQNNELTVVDLDSVGGDVREARAMAHVIQKYKLATRVSRLCGSACTDVFAAGQERLLLPPGRLGFHSCHPHFWFDKCDKETELEFFKSLGVDEDFIRKWQRVPNTDAWYPTGAELLAAHVITGTAIPTPPKLSAAPRHL